MRKKHTEEYKRALVSRCSCGESIAAIAKDTGVARSTIYEWISQARSVEFHGNNKQGLMFHTDRGSNYQSKRFCDLLRTMNITKSVSRAHIPYDNSVIETFLFLHEKGRTVPEEIPIPV